MLMRSELPPEIVAIILVAAGVFSAVCAIGDYEWFMGSSKAQFFVSMLGRNGARIFYVLFGALLALLGVLFATGVIPTSAH